MEEIQQKEAVQGEQPGPIPGPAKGAKQEKTVSIIKNVFLTLAVLTGIAVALKMREMTSPSAAVVLLRFAGYLSVYIGLKGKRHWAVPLVVTVSALEIVFYFTTIWSLGIDPAALPGMAVGALFTAFFGYLIFFFRREDVRTLFQKKPA